MKTKSVFIAVVALSLYFATPVRSFAQDVVRDRPFSMLIDSEQANDRLGAAEGATSPTWRDRKSGLIATCEVLKYAEFGATEWTLHLTNDGKERSPVVSELWSGDFVVNVDSVGQPHVFYSEGSHALATDFKPNEKTLTSGTPFSLQTFGGRSSDGVMPFFNIFGGDAKRGAIVAVGWSGNWKAEFTSQSPEKVRVKIGLQQAHFRLEPGESVRLPGVLMMPWTGDRVSAHNKFRRLMMAKYSPSNHPAMDLNPIGCSPYLKIGFNDVTEANLIDFVNKVHATDPGINTVWIDAGWNDGGFPEKTGNYDFDPKRLPHGLKPIGDLAHKLGYRFLVWFEPERIMAGTKLAVEHPDWVLEGGEFTPEVAYQTSFRLLDYGNPAARRWTIDYLSKMIADNGIDIYRQDFNMYPGFYWNHNEPADRVGIREIRHIEGLYAVWDALLAKFPKLIIDNCASGGRRLDYELMKRSVPLWRTDYVWGAPEYPRCAQAQTLGLSFWIPMYGEGTTSAELEQFASGLGSAYPMALDFNTVKALADAKPLVEAMKRIRSAFTQDYYPLTDYSADRKQTLAVQFNDPKADSGIILVFGDAIDLSKLKPSALSSSKYDWTDWSALGTTRRVDRSDTLRNGLPNLAGPATRPCVVLEYHAAK